MAASPAGRRRPRTTRSPQRHPAAGRSRVRRRGLGGGGAAGPGPRSLQPGDQRREHAGHGRTPVARPDPYTLPAPAGVADDRLRRGRSRRRGDAPGRRRLPGQAVRGAGAARPGGTPCAGPVAGQRGGWSGGPGAGQPAVAGTGRAGRAQRFHRADLRRVRDRQGSPGQLYPPAIAACRQAVHRDQLRGDPGQHARGHPVRPRERFLHRRHCRPARQVRAGRRRHHSSRRDIGNALGLQAKLLRVLQEREVERVGARKPINLDIRVLATTNRDLAAEVAAGVSARTSTIACRSSRWPGGRCANALRTSCRWPSVCCASTAAR